MLVLVRHGEATANAAGLLLGRSDAPLTDLGRRQVAALRGRLGRVGRLVASPLRRAIDTAEGLGLELPVEVDERWVEVDYGAHEGQSLRGVPSEVWQRWRGDPAYRPPDGESLADVGQRVRRACEELFADSDSGTGEGDPAASAGAARSPDGDVVVVSHVSPIKAAVAWAIGTGDDAAWRLHLSTGSVTRIGWGAAGPVVHCFNWTP